MKTNLTLIICKNIFVFEHTTKHILYRYCTPLLWYMCK